MTSTHEARITSIIPTLATVVAPGFTPPPHHHTIIRYGVVASDISGKTNSMSYQRMQHDPDSLARSITILSPDETVSVICPSVAIRDQWFAGLDFLRWVTALPSPSLTSPHPP